MSVPVRTAQAILWYPSIPSSNGFAVALLPVLPRTVTRSDIERDYQMDGTNGLKDTTRVAAPVAWNTLSVNVFTAPGKAMVGERPRPFGEALGFDPITSTLIFGEHDAVLDRLAALNPEIVVAGHKKPGAPDSPSAIHETKRYLEDFDRVQKTAMSDQELFDQMTELYPHWVANQSWLMFGFPMP